MPQAYDFIITGAGCAGLSLVMHLLQSGKFADKKILLIDEAAKNKNDRTWCFWEKGEGLFEPVVFRRWKNIWFYGESIEKELTVTPYCYKMIRGIDFYSHCFQTIKQHTNVRFLQGKVDRISSSITPSVRVNGEMFTASFVFNSLLLEKPQLSKKHNWFLQHFKGWQIKTQKPAFNTAAATLMDFRIPQNHGTAFCYVLPQSDSEALVEYTLFTPTLLTDEQYDEGLTNYVENVLKIAGYEVLDTEFGIIPMTNYRFSNGEDNVVNIGTAGGQTKGSSGYTFYFIQQHSKAIVNALLETGKPFVKSTPERFHFYDSVLLQVLQNGQLPGKSIFSQLFKKNKAPEVLTFLNNESSLLQELKIISSLPTLPFLQAAVKQVF